MNVIEKVTEQEQKLKELEAKLAENEKKKKKSWKIRIPWKIGKKTLKDDKKVAALFVGPNISAQWKTATAKDGVWLIDEDKDDKGYLYEENAIFHLKQKRKMIPFIVIFSWRLMTVGGKAEEYCTMLVGGKTTEEAAEATGI